ncbi:hypothetical protein K2173_011214 [Erythroxylum novogranatense]|uniref:DUF7755 domain-containing protein n=1 Tax=Erythroxylum novogranatense TaxID=1862640 RepID=A0AAV8TVN0_9ROSI|nr:hypothetical protein K2173_011214 [Erythroxylum novogranatense]
MESISVGQAVFLTNSRSFQTKINHSRAFLKAASSAKGRNFRIEYGFQRFQSTGFIRNYKHSDLQDFQAYAKPSRLLEATGLEVCTDSSQYKSFISSSVGGSRSSYKVKIQTSNMYGSSLSDQNAGIVLCLIDENGDSILQRIPAILKPNSTVSDDMIESNALHFQRGSVDEFTFYGPKLGRIDVLWVSVESGQWRLAGVSICVIDDSESSLNQNDGEETQYRGFQYEFKVDDVLLGEGGDMLMVEFRPSSVSRLSGIESCSLLDKISPRSRTHTDNRISTEESMREYADLKLSLLLYDTMLIIAGATTANFSVGEDTAFAFFVGGMIGFLYLLLLQKSVDGLSSSSLTSNNTNEISRLFQGFKGPLIPSIAVAIGLTSLAAKYSFGDIPTVLTPKELLAGMFGFLACKVAVLLAAFKPMSQGLKDKE